MSFAKNLVLSSLALLLSACGSVQYTVDDGRKLDEAFLTNLRLFGQGERVLRPAIFRSGLLKDPDCSKQWELPFSVASSYDWDEDGRVGWVRTLQVDERLTVVAATPGCGLEAGDKLVEIDGYAKSNSNKMLLELGDLRDSGKPFPVKTAAGKSFVIQPFEVCRGYTRLALPTKPQHQDFHWLMSVHPLELFNPQVTPDEALWMVLWTQGLSEEGGGRMKTFHYSKEFAIALIDVASLAFGLNAAAQAAQVAVNQAVTTAATSATKAISEAAAKKIIEDVGREAAQQAAKEYAQKIGEEIAKSLGKQAGIVLRDTFMSRLGFSVSSLSWVATTAFDGADRWAFERIGKLGADPIAAATLHRKLFERGLVSNVFVLDNERLGNLTILARNTQREEMLLSALRGGALEAFSLQLTDIPLASSDGLGLDIASDESFSRQRTGTGLSGEMPTNMPSASEDN